MADRRDLLSGWLALVVTAALQVFLPENLSVGPGWAAVAVVGILMLVMFATHRERWLPWHHMVAHFASGVVTAALVYSVVALVVALVQHRGQPAELLASAVLLWFSNILVFATWYWRLDAGGPHARSTRDFHESGAFLFPQMTLPDEDRDTHGIERWRPRFVDYLFVAFNTSTAFSPTDVPVLSSWAKMLMMAQSVISLTTLALLAARAVNIL